MTDKKVAEMFPPGEFLREELEARNLSQIEFAEIIGKTPTVVNEILMGKRSITPETAKAIANAFGTSAQLWMNLESAYQLWKAKDADESIARRSKLYQKAPIKELIKRGWIEPSNDLDVLEERVRNFLGIPSLDDSPKLCYAPKESGTAETPNPWQVAWICRAMKLAKGIAANKFTTESFENALAQLQKLRENPEDACYVPKVLAKGGVRFLLIESFPKGKIDGACFWLNNFSPVIVIAMKYDRIDHFWYLLMHECGHVKNRDAQDKPILDIDLVGEGAIPFKDKSEMERRADLFAENFLVEKKEMDNFIARTGPLYSKQKIKNFAMRIGVHPAIVLGQLQHRDEVDWSHSREMLVKIRDILISSALTDGWGHKPPAIA